MPKIIRPPFKPHSLRKLREISGATVEEAAKRVQKDAETVRRWESDASPDLPTYGQGRKLGALYGYDIITALDEVPADIVPPSLPDFRTPDSEGWPTDRFSLNLRRSIRAVNLRQRVVRDFAGFWELPHHGWVGSVAVDSTTPEDLGYLIRDQLRISVDEQLSFSRVAKSPYERARIAMKAWTNAADRRAGIFVSQVGNHRGREVQVHEMRGFSLADPVAPFAVVNARDAMAARVFTLLHEVAHLWIGASGISGNAGMAMRAMQDRSGIEAYCDEAAASALMPVGAFSDSWLGADGIALDARAARVAEQFTVSRDAVAVRAAKHGLISWDEYRVIRDAFERSAGSASKRPGSGGGDYYNTLLRNVGEKYVRLVIGAWLEDQIGLKQAARYLQIKPGYVYRLAQRLGVRF